MCKQIKTFQHCLISRKKDFYSPLLIVHKIADTGFSIFVIE